MSELNDLSRSLTSLQQDKTIIAVIEMSQSSWLVAGVVPGIERHPLKKLEPSEEELVRLLMRWRTEATKNGHTITRFAVASHPPPPGLESLPCDSDLVRHATNR